VSLDWEGARARLRAAQERLDEIDHEVGDFEALLRARAEAIAAAHATPPRPGVSDVVVFRIGTERFSVAAVEVGEVIDVVHLTALPGVPAFYRGLLSHRGVVFPLVDLRPLVGATPDEHPFALALLFASDARTVAVGVDDVDLLQGVGTVDGVVPLDIWTVLSDARLVVDG